MRAPLTIIITIIGLILQACAHGPVGPTKRVAERPAEHHAVRTLDARVQVHVPQQIKHESFVLSDELVSLDVSPGLDLNAAALDVSAAFFSDVRPLSFDRPTDFILKLNAESYVSAHQREHLKGVLTAQLYNAHGEELYRQTVIQTLSPDRLDNRAFYALYARATERVLESLLRDEAPMLTQRLAQSRPERPDSRALVAHQTLDLASTGTGFFVNRGGHVVTNQHVVAQCAALTIDIGGQPHTAHIVNSDAERDIAVLATGYTSPRHARFNATHKGERLGEHILTLGYPLHGVLSSSINLTTGNISSMLGIQDDTNVYQITAPIQAGNSGGPVINQRGLVAGIVQSKLNALELSRYTGDLAQNVNFAVKSASIRAFLRRNQIDYHIADYADLTEKSTVELAAEAKSYTVQIKCHG
ncbi:MAG TPA: hypothetical protein DD979_08605 [Gammaproteobacteria bacterium]|jgi:S1-C subfamily serine protease|nr:hypothetical protein [Gammaproteobacteria bacterium]